jgi:hypothetical protein
LQSIGNAVIQNVAFDINPGVPNPGNMIYKHDCRRENIRRRDRERKKKKEKEREIERENI